MIVRRAGEELGDGFSKDRVPETGCQLVKGCENESPLGDPGMRQRERISVEDTLVVEEEVDIDNSRFILFPAGSSQAGLDRKEPGEKIFRGKSGFDLRHQVQVFVLRGYGGGEDRLGFIH